MNTTLPRKCGKVCAKTKHEAKLALETYLLKLREAADDAYKSYVEVQQDLIGAENSSQLDVDGNDRFKSKKRFDHFGYIHNLDDIANQPGNVLNKAKEIDCPKTVSPNSADAPNTGGLLQPIP